MSDQLREKYIEALEAENDELRARMRDMERDFGFDNPVPIILGLTPSEAKLLALLIERESASKQQLLTAVMINRGADEEPEIKIVDVYICKIRRKLKQFGIEIETVWGRGYRMSVASKAKVASCLAASQAAQ